MKILSIGNSFSQDAQRYLHCLAKHDGVDMKTVNLYIGGCPLRTHYLNMLDDEPAYSFEFNGESTGIKVSIRQALKSDSWDYVTLQQASVLSSKFETYTPYIEELARYVKKYCPTAKILIHETWAYAAETGTCGFSSPEEMANAVFASYAKAKDAINAHGVIPSGEVMLKASQLGVTVHSADGHHAARGAGRYLLALTWFKKLTGMDITGNTFNDFDVEITDVEREKVIEAVNSVL